MMDINERCAFVIAQAACANAEIAAMQAENQQRVLQGYSIAYNERAFMDVQNKYLIEHNAVIEYLRH